MKDTDKGRGGLLCGAVRLLKGSKKKRLVRVSQGTSGLLRKTRERLGIHLRKSFRKTNRIYTLRSLNT